MSTTRRAITAGVAVLATAALAAGIGYETAPHAHAATSTSKARKAKAVSQYRADLSPSLAWNLASSKERKHATAAYLELAGSWNNGCRKDLRHAYQGTTGKGNMANVQPYLPVYRADVKGRDIFLGPWVTGICGDQSDD